jgi:triacylglycerol esterase/lipase EstA (alpha/beta hydrolase family)
MKLIFIHGFVEDHTIFNEIRKTITQGEQIALDLETVLRDWKNAPKDLDVVKMASYLIQQYKITAQDCVIGHSMGGWIASYIKEEIGSKAILLASFTDQEKLITPLTNPTLIKYCISWGIFQSSVMDWFLKKNYKFQESKQLYDGLIDGLIKMDKTILYQQCLVLFAKVKPLTITPDLRVHARKDNIVGFPDEGFVEVSGDHFSLIYYPQEVISAIQKVV